MFAMASLSATSLDVVRHWVAGREAATNGTTSTRQSENYSKAVELDPKFGLGYQGLANVSRNLTNQEDAKKYVKRGTASGRQHDRARTLYGSRWFPPNYWGLSPMREGVQRVAARPIRRM